MYESMLSSLPLYSVWPHLRRMMSSVPTLRRCIRKDLFIHSNWIEIKAQSEGNRVSWKAVPSLQKGPRVDWLELQGASTHVNNNIPNLK